jgi:hypothetical protein
MTTDYRNYANGIDVITSADDTRASTTVCVCVCRPWDMSRFMYLECRSSRIPFPRWATRWVNVRKIYSNSYRLSRVSLVTMLEYLGLSFEGRQHCGLDDARNIARILTYMIKDGCNVYVNERMFDSKLAALGAALSCQYDAEVTCVVRGDDDEDDDADAVAACVERTKNHLPTTTTTAARNPRRQPASKPATWKG